MALRPARDIDWVAMTGLSPPDEWFGYVEATNHLVEGIGAIYRDGEGRWWVTFQRLPFVSKVKTAHKAAKQLIAAARERGIEVRAIADPRIDGAELWIERLGFQRTDETIGGYEVWALN